MSLKLSVKIMLIALISLFVGLIYVYPDLRFQYELKGDYRGIGFSAAADELGYLARIKAVYKGNPTCRGIDIFEHRNEPWLLPFLGEFIEGSVGRLFNINVASLDVAMSFILPVILFWLVFILFRSLCGSAAYSLFGSALILFGYNLFAVRFPVILKQIFIFQDYAQPLWFLRPISPQFNHIFFIVALLMIYIAINKKSKFFVFLAAISSGILFYVHPHYWIYIYAGFSVFAFFSIITGRRFGKMAFYFAIISLLVSIPFWLHLYLLKSDPNLSSALSFTGLTYTHKPILPIFHLILAAAAIILLWYSKDPDLLFLSSFLIGGFICLNQQIITGVTLVPGHWQGYTNKTFIMIALTVSLFKAVRIPLGKGTSSMGRFLIKAGNVIAIVAVLILAIVGFAQQNSYYKAHAGKAKVSQAIAGAYLWLNQNAGNADVVLVDPFNYLLRNSPYSFEVLTYTNCYIYQPSGCTSLASKQEQEDRLLYAFNFFGYPPQKVESFLRYANGAFFAGIEVLPEYGGRPLPEEEISRVNDKYLRLKHVDKIEVMRKFRLNYIIIDSRDLSKYNEKISLKQLKNAYIDGDFCILKVL